HRVRSPFPVLVPVLVLVLVLVLETRDTRTATRTRTRTRTGSAGTRRGIPARGGRARGRRYTARSMLQRVALGQVRFNLPGLVVDGRGVVGGRQLAVRFGAIDRLVSFFRILSAEQSLDDLQPGLRILQARASAGTREAIVVLPAGSAHLGDTAARMAGGQSFTGNGKHFVQYRDARAPLGYDASAISQEAADLIFYGLEHTVAY